MLQDIFKWVLVASCIGTVIVFLIVLTRPLTKKVFSYAWHYYIWLVVPAVMIIPIKFNIPVNGVDKIPGQIRMIAVTGQKVMEPVTQTTVYQMGVEEIWLAGAVILLLVKLLSYVAFRFQLRRSGEEICCSITENFTDRKIKVIQSKMTASPFMTGLFKPILVFPATPMTERQLGFVLAHEMIHLKRKDILYKWIVCIAKCVHWFNPIIYFAARQIDIECEISCDIGATEFMNRKEKKAYADTVLTLASARVRKLPLSTGMADSKKIMKKRILSITKERKQGKIIKIFSMITLTGCMIGILFISGAAAGIMMEKIQPKLEVVGKLPVFEKIFGGLEIEKTTESQIRSILVENEESRLEETGEKETEQKDGDYPAEEFLAEEFIKPENAKVIKYSSDDKVTHYITLCPDENGLITVYFDSEVNNAIAEVNIYDSDRPGQGWGYRVATDGENAYEFDGFDPEKNYTVEINTYCPGNYGIEGNVYVY